MHAASPGAIRELTLDDIDLPNRRLTIAGHRLPLCEFTRHALLGWLGYRRAAWPDTANRLISRISALGTGPVSPDYLDKHQLRGVSLERIRRDCILQEALATGADPLHLTLVFNIDHTKAMAYANAARDLLSGPAEQAPLTQRPECHDGRAVRGEQAGQACRPGWCCLMGPGGICAAGILIVAVVMETPPFVLPGWRWLPRSVRLLTLVVRAY